jgi:hypothetical protein
MCEARAGLKNRGAAALKHALLRMLVTEQTWRVSSAQLRYTLTLQQLMQLRAVLLLCT